MQLATGACLLALLATTGGQFSIDYADDTFVMDGKPFQYVSGSMHYFRCPRQLWRDRLRKMREAGLNAVSTYVEWSQHEKQPGEYDFTGDLDVNDFIRTAAQESLYVILRPGPYICAERDMGGLPAWLLRDPDIRLRTSDPRYTQPVERWMNVLLQQVNPLLFGNGGPIILVQVENEYGSYPACDGRYLIWLRDLLKSQVKENAVLFTTDGAAESYLKCGKIPGVYATVDFGPGYNISAAFAAQRRYEPRGPLVNSEFYPGWLTHWGEARATVNGLVVANTLRQLLQRRVNINFYMFHGGTNFGFTAGANYGSRYQSDITSYDYDAPMTEAGDLTLKYHIIKAVLAEFHPLPMARKQREDVAPKADYGELNLVHIASLLSPQVRSLLGNVSTAAYPQTFEAIGNYFGYVLYETTLPQNVTEVAVLRAKGIRDHGVVLLNGTRVGTLSREHQNYNVTLMPQPGANLSVLVENLGRINYGAYNNDTKGLGNATLGKNVLENWTLTGFPLDSVETLLDCTAECLLGHGFRFYATRFVLNTNMTDSHHPDTFLDLSSLKKGVVFINNRNLGRYWTHRGPQYSLYVPGVWLNTPPLENVIVIFDEQVNADSIHVRFSKHPIWSPRTSEADPMATLV